MKRCPRCGETKSVDEFYKNSHEKDGLSTWCKECTSAYSKDYRERNRERLNARERQWKADNPLKVFASDIRQRYGITLEEYDEKLEAQGGGCAICGKTPEENGQRLCADHDHETGIFRGVLCTHCNAGLGMFQDNIALLGDAMFYLRIWRRQSQGLARGRTCE